MVAKGFQEELKPQSDSPTVLRDSLKTILVLTANEDFEISTVDIMGAFLQGEKLDRTVFVKPPPDEYKKNPGIIWKLNKCLYGLNDASRNFYYRVRPLLEQNGFKISGQDEAFWYKNENGVLKGMVAIHVDDFIISGPHEFRIAVIDMVKDNLTVSKIEHSRFRFTGIDIDRRSDGSVKVSMEVYVNQMQEISDFRKCLATDAIDAAELNIYRGYVGKFLRLAQNVRPYMAQTALEMATKTTRATMKDYKYINTVVRTAKSRVNAVIYNKVAQREDLVVKAVCDASYYASMPAVSGEIILLASKHTDVVSPLYWKSKTIIKVCKSSKDAETRAADKCVEDAKYMTERVEKLLFGDSKTRIKTEVYTDSEPLIESLGTTKRVENTALCNTIEAMKESLMEKRVSKIQYINTKKNPSDILTKRMTETADFYNIFLHGRFVADTETKKVTVVKREHTDELRVIQGKG